MKNLFDLTDKIALVTGASSGMGKAIAEAMGGHGATVIVASNDTEGVSITVQEFEKQQIRCLGVTCDMSQKEDIDRLFTASLSAFGRIDILVSCVGIAPSGSFLDIQAVDFEKTMAINLQSAIYLTKKILPQMQAQKDGAIIYLASIASVRGNKNIGLYGLSKAGLVQLARNLAVEFGPDNIRVNAISPGMINTTFSQSLMSNKDFMTKRLALTPLRRVGEVEEIAGVAVMLASKAGAFITGQNIIVDGGTTISDGN
ncbi:MAG: SDR family oxidoreductase [Saprospiraceae bacterium]|nr:SDR family oxidoreductase [Saprospiraceae bacterium]